MTAEQKPRGSGFGAQRLNNKGGVYCEDCDTARVGPANDNGSSGVRPYAIDKAAAEALWD